MREEAIGGVYLEGGRGTSRLLLSPRGIGGLGLALAPSTPD